MLVLFKKKAMKVSDGGKKKHLLIPVSLLFKMMSIPTINLNTAPCAVGWRVLPDYCQVPIPFLMLIITLSPRLYGTSHF